MSFINFPEKKKKSVTSRTKWNCKHRNTPQET